MAKTKSSRVQTPSPYSSAILFAAACAGAGQLARAVQQEIRPITGAIVVPQVLLGAFSAAGSLGRDADNVAKQIRAVIVASGGKCEPGSLTAVMGESTKRTPSWKEIAIDLAAKLHGPNFNAEVWVNSIIAGIEPTTSITVAVKPVA